MIFWCYQPDGLLFFQTLIASFGLSHWLIVSYVFLSDCLPELLHLPEIFVLALPNYIVIVYEYITIKFLFSHIGNYC